MAMVGREVHRTEPGWGCHVSSFNVCHRLRIRALPVSEMMPFRSPTVGRNRAISPANPTRWSMSLRGSAVLPQRQPDGFPGWPLAWVSSTPPWHGGVGAQRLRGQCVAGWRGPAQLSDNSAQGVLCSNHRPYVGHRLASDGWDQPDRLLSKVHFSVIPAQTGVGWEVGLN